MGFAPVGERSRSLSAGSDGQGVGVVGEDRPLSPDLLAFVALEPAAVRRVAAFEVADPAFVEAGRSGPRAPRFVFSVGSHSWVTCPNSFGLPSLPLRIGLAFGSNSD